MSRCVKRLYDARECGKMHDDHDDTSVWRKPVSQPTAAIE